MSEEQQDTIPEELKGNPNLLITIDQLYRAGLIKPWTKTKWHAAGVQYVAQLVCLQKVTHGAKPYIHRPESLGGVHLSERVAKGNSDYKLGKTPIEETEAALAQYGLGFGMCPESFYWQITTKDFRDGFEKNTPNQEKILELFELKGLEAPSLPVKVMPSTRTYAGTEKSGSPTTIQCKKDKITINYDLTRIFGFSVSPERREKMAALLKNKFRATASRIKLAMARDFFLSVFPEAKEGEMPSDETLAENTLTESEPNVSFNKDGDSLVVQIPITHLCNAAIREQKISPETIHREAETFVEDLREMMQKTIK